MLQDWLLHFFLLLASLTMDLKIKKRILKYKRKELNQD